MGIQSVEFGERGTIQVYNFFPKILLSFPGGVENAYSQVSRKWFNQFVFADYDQGTQVIQKLFCRWKLHRLEKTEETLNIYNTSRFSSSFPQNDCNVCGHLILVTDDLENVGQDQNLQNFSFLTCEYFFKKLPTSNLSEFGIITAINNRHCFQKFCYVFHLFPIEWKTKSFMDL